MKGLGGFAVMVSQFGSNFSFSRFGTKQVRSSSKFNIFGFDPMLDPPKYFILFWGILAHCAVLAG